MRILLLLLTALNCCVFASEKLRIYDEMDGQLPLVKTSDYGHISSELGSVGIRFEKWETSQPLPGNARENDVFAAYRQDIDRLVRENNYQTVDIVRMFPDSPKKVELRNKFLNEHTHTEDEVRLFVEGSGLFYMHAEGKVFIVLCEEGDLISIPAHYAHWFDMGEAPHFTAIRFFNNTSGWVAHFTDSPIAEKFPRFENVVE